MNFVFPDSKWVKQSKNKLFTLDYRYSWEEYESTDVFVAQAKFRAWAEDLFSACECSLGLIGEIPLSQLSVCQVGTPLQAWLQRPRLLCAAIKLKIRN